VRNVSTRPLTVRIRGRGLAARPARVRLLPRGRADVRLFLRTRSAGVGLLRVVPETGVQQRALWSAPTGQAPTELLSDVRLSARRFEPSDSAPAVLSFQAGRVVRTGGRLELEPVSRLEVQLWTDDGDRVGALAELRDLLPGRYAFGLTGRGPGGNVLPKGDYRLRLVAVPTGIGATTRRTLRLTIR
jgi:hypothetical protein